VLGQVIARELLDAAAVDHRADAVGEQRLSPSLRSSVAVSPRRNGAMALSA
jgi:hypothetical protein